MSLATMTEEGTMNCTKILPAVLLLLLLLMPAAAAPLYDTTKAVIVSFHYKDGTVTPVGSRVIYGYPPDNFANRDMLIDIVGKNSAVIGSYGIEDPRIKYTEGSSTERRTDVRFSVILPFAAAGDHVDLYDGQTRQKLATADITVAIAKFCNAHRDDPDCGGGGSPVTLYSAAGILILVMAGAGLYLFLKRRKPPA